MPSIKLENVCRYICRDVNLEVRDKELMVLLGPNGAGKTTLLDIVAGLTDYEGQVFFDGSPVDRRATCQREVGYLFQHLVLFPHMTVANNIAYGLLMVNRPRSQIEARVKEMLHMLRIEHLAGRYPGRLSGGERQRVAIARALARSPRVLLLDEPLSSLDLQTSKYLRTELRQLQSRLEITTLYVTHDLEEAEEMADRVAIILDGKLEQVAASEEVLFYPKNKPVSEFIGSPNILECDACRGAGHGVVEVDCQGLSIVLPHDGDSVRRIALFPRDIYVTDAPPPGPPVNRFKGVITGVGSVSTTMRLDIKTGGLDLLAEMPQQIFEDMGLAVGKEVFLILKWKRIRAYENRKGR